MELSVYVDGKFYPQSEAKVSVFDHGLLYGDGVFEGIRAYNGRVFKLDRHLDRLYHSAKAIDLKIPHTKEEMANIILETCRRAERGRDCTAGHLLVRQGVRAGPESGDFLVPARAAPELEPVDQVAELPEQHHGPGRGEPVRRRRGLDARHPRIRVGGDRGELLHRPQFDDRHPVDLHEPPRGHAGDGPRDRPAAWLEGGGTALYPLRRLVRRRSIHQRDRGGDWARRRTGRSDNRRWQARADDEEDHEGVPGSRDDDGYADRDCGAITKDIGRPPIGGSGPRE